MTFILAQLLKNTIHKVSVDSILLFTSKLFFAKSADRQDLMVDYAFWGELIT